MVVSDVIFFFQAEDGIRDLVRSRGLGDVYKRQGEVGGLSLHEYFAKLCTQVTAALSEVTEGATVFRLSLIHI